MATNRNSKPKSVDLGQIQANFEKTQAEYHQSERELARANEARDKKKAAFLAADQALQGAVRTIRG